LVTSEKAAPIGAAIESPGTAEGDLKDFHSVRMNGQWRVIFRWRDGEADEVRIVDYH
jgi:proteic killer suppression protein